MASSDVAAHTGCSSRDACSQVPPQTSTAAPPQLQLSGGACYQHSLTTRGSSAPQQGLCLRMHVHTTPEQAWTMAMARPNRLMGWLQRRIPVRSPFNGQQSCLFVGSDPDPSFFWCNNETAVSGVSLESCKNNSHRTASFFNATSSSCW